MIFACVPGTDAILFRIFSQAGNFMGAATGVWISDENNN